MAEDPDTIEVVSSDHTRGNPFVCNVCKRSYSRIDHLARHYRSHSQERPFTCTICDKTFARVDLLKRHATTHDSAATQSDSPPPKRRRNQADVNRPRAQKACRACAEAKARCEGGSPCARCSQKRIECEYIPNKSNSATAAPRVTAVVDHDTRPIDSSLLSANDDHLSDTELSMHGNMAPASCNGNIVVPDPTNQAVFPLSTPAGSGFGHMVNQTDNQIADLSSSGSRYSNAFHPDATTFNENLISLDFLPLGMNDHTISFDDLLNDDLFTSQGLSFGVEFAFNSPTNLDPAVTSSLRAPQKTLASAVVDDPEPAHNRSGIITPGLRNKLNITASAQAFKESFWRWTPAKDDHGSSEQRHLSIAWDGMIPGPLEGNTALPSHQRMTDSARGAVLAMILRTCEPNIYQGVLSNFPSSQVMTQLIQDFLSFQSMAECPFIHISTVEVAIERAEFLAIMVAYGAALSSRPEVRKLGFALQEAQRAALPREFERDNRLTRQLRPLQCLALEHEIGLWSGNRRKMEIAESESMHLITMLRRAGHFRGAKIAELSPLEQDTGDELESKWRAWVQQESFKRLALSVFYKDTRSSMSLLTQPLISYAELTTSPPCRKDLWDASTALEWKNVYLQSCQGQQAPVQTGRAWMDDSAYVLENQQYFDGDLSLLLITASIWPRLWQYHEMIIANRNGGNSRDGHGSLITNSKRQDLLRLLELASMNAKEWHVDFKPAVWLLHEQCSMHLCVSLEEVQMLAGKEGEDECRRVFPTMKAWVKTPEARQALFHAGQIIRAAKQYGKHMLRDSSAVAVYHASLVFWAYAITSRDEHHVKFSPESVPLRTNESYGSDLIRLDDVEGPEIRRFLLLGRGIPCIHVHVSGQSGLATRDVPLTEPGEVMSTISSILKKQYDEVEGASPPLIDNLSRLMLLLGKAYIPQGKHQ